MDNIQSIIILIVVGALAGWLGSLIFKGKGLGFVGNLIVGIIGCFFGGWLFNVIGISQKLIKGRDWQWVNTVIIGAIGAIIILALINLIFKKKK